MHGENLKLIDDRQAHY